MKRYLFIFILLNFLVSCTTTGIDTEAPKSTPNTSKPFLIQTKSQNVLNLLNKANREPTAQSASSLRLQAAQLAHSAGNIGETLSILQNTEIQYLDATSQITYQSMYAEIDLIRKQYKSAISRIKSLDILQIQSAPIQVQRNVNNIYITALEASGNNFEALRERVFFAPQLADTEKADNLKKSWDLALKLPSEQNLTGNKNLDGWIEAANIAKTGGINQNRSVISFINKYPNHDATKFLKANNIAISSSIKHIALVLPQSGGLAAVATQIKEGFLDAAKVASQNGIKIPHISFIDANAGNDFYNNLQAVDLVVGPLDKEQVRQIEAANLATTKTLALNTTGRHIRQNLYQFGLAIEDETEELVRYAYKAGHRNAIALAPSGSWGSRALNAFRKEWGALGGNIVETITIDDTGNISNQIADAFKIQASANRLQKVVNILEDDAVGIATPTNNIDVVFMALDSFQAHSVKTSLDFQGLGSLPIYATNHINESINPTQNKFLAGVNFVDIPFLIHHDDPRYANYRHNNSSNQNQRYYAFGADSFNIAMRALNLQTPLEGLTGTLSIKNNVVQRRIPLSVISK